MYNNSQQQELYEVNESDKEITQKLSQDSVLHITENPM